MVTHQDGPLWCIYTRLLRCIYTVKGSRTRSVYAPLLPSKACRTSQPHPTARCASMMRPGSNSATPPRLRTRTGRRSCDNSLSGGCAARARRCRRGRSSRSDEAFAWYTGAKPRSQPQRRQAVNRGLQRAPLARAPDAGGVFRYCLNCPPMRLAHGFVGTELHQRDCQYTSTRGIV